MLMRRPLALLTLLAFGTAHSQPSCPGARIDTAATQRRLKSAEALWRRRGAANYRLTVSPSNVWSFGGGVTVKVRGGRAVGGWEQEGSRLPPPPGATRPPSASRTSLSPERAAEYTVPALFEDVRRHLERARATGSCGRLEVVFDPFDGHPKSVSGYTFYAVDDVFGLFVNEFGRLP